MTIEKEFAGETSTNSASKARRKAPRAYATFSLNFIMGTSFKHGPLTSERKTMKREITIPEIIEMLQQLPESATISVDTKKEVKIVGIVVQRADNVRQIADIVFPREK